jgi:hypothetical protein
MVTDEGRQRVACAGGKGPSEKYNRSAMGKASRLQCNALREREKSRRRKNNGKQWKKQCAEQ